MIHDQISKRFDLVTDQFHTLFRIIANQGFLTRCPPQEVKLLKKNKLKLNTLLSLLSVFSFTATELEQGSLVVICRPTYTLKVKTFMKNVCKV